MGAPDLGPFGWDDIVGVVRADLDELRLVVAADALVALGLVAPGQRLGIEPELLRIDESVEREQAASVAAVRAGRDASRVQAALAELKRACADPEINVMPKLIACVTAYATEGEIVEAMVEVYGRYVERAAF